MSLGIGRLLGRGLGPYGRRGGPGGPISSRLILLNVVCEECRRGLRGRQWPGEGAMPRVLVVEDQKRLLASLRRGLEEEGFEVEAAPTGEEGYYLATTRPPDVLVL